MNFSHYRGCALAGKSSAPGPAFIVEDVFFTAAGSGYIRWKFINGLLSSFTLYDERMGLFLKKPICTS